MNMGVEHVKIFLRESWTFARALSVQTSLNSAIHLHY